MNLLKKSLFLIALASLILMGCKPKAEETQQKKMNVLFIAVDDLKPLLGCYGDTIVVSPNIDKLGEEGTVFLNNHTQQAVCAPSRASLLTGWRPDRTEVWNLHTLIRDKNPNVVTLPQYFKQNGYQTAARGKVFDLRSVDKFHDKRSWTYPYEYPTKSRWIGTKERLFAQCVDLPDSDFIDGNIEEQSVKLLEKMAKSKKPFFLAVGFKKPHLPFVAPKKCWDLYDRSKLPLAKFRKHAKNAPEFAFQPGWELRHGYDHVPQKGPLPIPMQKELIHGYYACVSHVDEQIGKLLKKLDELGLKDNTIIVLWGDHGWHLGDHMMWCKHTNFEQATRSPLIIVDPRIKGGKKASSPTEFVDIFPTLCELTGLKVPSGLDGKSLVPILKNPKVKIKDYAVSQFHRVAYGKRVEGYTLRTDHYRYTVWVPLKVRKGAKFKESEIVAAELYDYVKDPLETVNHFNEPAYKKIQARLQQYMREYFKNRKINKKEK